MYYEEVGRKQRTLQPCDGRELYSLNQKGTDPESTAVEGGIPIDPGRLWTST